MSTGRTFAWSLALALALAGCIDPAELGSDCAADGGCTPPTSAGGSGAVNQTLPLGPEMLSGIASLDLLFVIDDAPGMSGQQQALGEGMPLLIDRLLHGELDGVGLPEFEPLTEVRAAVVAANRGQGSTPVAGCLPRSPGLLLDTSAGPGCGPTHPALMRFPRDGMAPPASELGCAVQLGARGCGVSQPFEAMLEGLQSMVAAQGGGWADDSLQLVVVLSNQEDCSTGDGTLLVSDAMLAPGDPLLGVPDALRCTANPTRLQGYDRYRRGLAALRPGLTDRLLFFAIAGFPEDRVGEGTYLQTGFSDSAERAALYAPLLQDPRMRYAATLGPTGRVGDACGDATVLATPARRLAEFAQLLGPTARIGSLCGDQLEAHRELLQLVAAHVGVAEL